MSWACCNRRPVVRTASFWRVAVLRGLLPWEGGMAVVACCFAVCALVPSLSAVSHLRVALQTCYLLAGGGLIGALALIAALAAGSISVDAVLGKQAPR